MATNHSWRYRLWTNLSQVGPEPASPSQCPGSGRLPPAVARGCQAGALPLTSPCALFLVQLRHCMSYDTAWGNIACLLISSSSSNSRGTTGQPRRLTSWSAYCSCSLIQQHMHGCEQAPAAVLSDAFALQAPVTCQSAESAVFQQPAQSRF